MAREIKNNPVAKATPSTPAMDPALLAVLEIVGDSKAYKELETLKSYEVYIANLYLDPKYTPVEKSNVKCRFILEYFVKEDGRIIKDYRIVPQGLDFLCDQLATQLKLNAIPQRELLMKCLAEKTSLTLWVTEREWEGQVYHNYTFKKPTLKDLEKQTQDLESLLRE